jgi:hypothetical protein
MQKPSPDLPVLNHKRSFGSWAALICLPLTGAFYHWCRWYADRMVARGEGFEMAFYFSPLAFRAIASLRRKPGEGFALQGPPPAYAGGSRSQ